MCVICTYIRLDKKAKTYLMFAHRSFRGRAGFHPTCHPALPELDILENPTLQRYALDLAAQLDVRHLFVDCGEVD